MIDVRATARALKHAAATVRQQPYAQPGHFYSPLTTPADAERAVGWLKLDPAGVDVHAAAQLDLFNQLIPAAASYRPDRYRPGNNQYGAADAAVLHAMLARVQPKRVVEVGSGHSTAVMLDTIDQHALPTRVTCVEPYPDRLLAQLRPGDRPRVDLHQNVAQDVPVADFDLDPGDVLFIDSTHVVKPGSDVVWLYLHVLPTLKPGVLVHIHDIFWPFEYPEQWLRERRDWTELYLLQALLTEPSAWRIELFGSWLWQTHPELVPEQLLEPGPSHIWLRKTV